MMPTSAIRRFEVKRPYRLSVIGMKSKLLCFSSGFERSEKITDVYEVIG